MTPRKALPPASPIAALTRWLAQLHYNHIRQVETLQESVSRLEDGKPLRGILVAPDLVLTRQRAFYVINGAIAIPASLETVAAKYNLDAMQASYRIAMDAWKSAKRRVS